MSPLSISSDKRGFKNFKEIKHNYYFRVCFITITVCSDQILLACTRDFSQWEIHTYTLILLHTYAHTCALIAEQQRGVSSNLCASESRRKQSHCTKDTST